MLWFELTCLMSERIIQVWSIILKGNTTTAKNHSKNVLKLSKC